MRGRRWSDNDHDFGPLTFAWSPAYRHFALMLSSGDDEGSSACLRLSASSATVILALPRWLVPTEKRKVFPRTWDTQTVARLGRNWHIDQTERAYGVSLSDGHLNVAYGRQSNDSSTEQRWGWFLPWTQWRHVRHTLYGLDGQLFAHAPEYGAKLGAGSWEEFHRLYGACPAASFSFTDFDGEALTVATKIEEREWLLGTGWFKWLSIFRAPKVRRSLDLRFSGETGRRKGSWKGGTMGHSIAMRPGELHASAFQRYCAEHEMTFVGPVDA